MGGGALRSRYGLFAEPGTGCDASTGARCVENGVGPGEEVILGRNKILTDDEALLLARAAFLDAGHDLSVRELASRVGLSTATLYQRFGGKEDLFFRALAPTPPDPDTWPNPEHAEDGLAFLLELAEALAQWFDNALPSVLRLMAHPHGAEKMSGPHADLHSALVGPVQQRLDRLIARGLMRGEAATAAQLVVTLAHDVSISTAMLHGARGTSAQLAALIELAWTGLAPTEYAGPTADR